MATRKDIEMADRFLKALDNELAEISARFNRKPSEIFTENVQWHSSVRALIAHAKQTIPAEPTVLHCEPEPQPPAFDNPANADDYNTLHDYFDRGGK